MSSHVTRRLLLAGLLSGAASAALAEAPLATQRPLPRGMAPVPPPRVPQSEALVQKANLGGKVAFAVADAGTGEILEARLGDEPMPPASTLKVLTALYGLDRLGSAYRFKTQVIATGPIVDGRLDGDLVLVGGGDPTLDTDRLADLARAMRESGLHEVTGRYLLWPGVLPTADRIDGEQPEIVSYNPSFGGLNLNYNRVHFQWQRQQDDYVVTMHARARNFSPATDVATMTIIDRKAPVFDYRAGSRRDYWSVARGALGKDGARWLPVRFPEWYAGDVFRTLARSNGILLGNAEVIDGPPVGTVVATIESEALEPVLSDMLTYSTNLTAEIVGLASSQAGGASPQSLAQSGAAMQSWALINFGVKGAMLGDHSGLGYDTVLPAQGMVRVLAANPRLAPLLKTVNLSLDKARPAPPGVIVHAKTGTLNFVSALAGYILVAGGRTLVFSIMTADNARRDAVPRDERERPQGSKGWATRSRQLQKELIRDWVRLYA